LQPGFKIVGGHNIRTAALRAAAIRKAKIR
jgi:hypothetical protein